MREGRTRRAADLLSDFLVRTGASRNVSRAKAVAAWPEVVGPEIEKHTRSVEMRGGELLVYVDAPTWANELSMMSPRLIEAINRAAGEDARVESIRFKVSRRADRSAERGRERRGEERPGGSLRVDTEPLTPQEEERILASTAGVASGELREAAAAAMRADMRWKKALEKVRRARADGHP